MAWIELHQAVWTHRKTFELASLLDLDDTYAAAHVIRLWTWALDNAPDGDLSGLSDRAVAYGAGWRGAAEAFIAALTGAGWLDQDRRIHDWEAYAGRLAERRRANAERMRNARAANVQDTVRTREGLPDLTGPNSTGPDTTGTPPKPPPQAGGGLAKTNGTRRRRDPSEVATVPLVPADRERWSAALAYMERGGALKSIFTGVMAHLEPVARAEHGGLLLRAPPDLRPSATQNARVFRNALEKVGDAAGNRAAIIE